MFGGIKSLVKDRQPSTATMPVPGAPAPIVTESSGNAGFGLGSNIREKISAARPVTPAPISTTPLAPTTPAISNAQIVSYLRTNPGDMQIAADMQKYGVTPEQMAQATGASLEEVQNRFNTAIAQTQGISSLDTSGQGGASTVLPAASFNRGKTTVEQLYKDVLGRDPTASELSQWKKTFGATVNTKEADKFRSAVAPELITNAYQNVFGRGADETNIDYWTGQLKSKSVTYDDLINAVAGSAQGVEDRIAAQAYLGKDIFAPTDYLRGTEGSSYQDVVNYINANIADPTEIYRQAASRGVDANEILQAYEALGKSPYTLADIEGYLATGKKGYETKFDEIIDKVFGDEDDQQQVQQALYNTYTRQVREYVDRETAGYNLSAAQKEQIVNRLVSQKTPETLFQETFKPDAYLKKSYDDIETILEASSANKAQEAVNLANLSQYYFGYDDEQALELYNKAIVGEGLSEIEQKVFANLLENNTLTKDVYDDLIAYTAVNNPNSKVFEDKPELKQLYAPVGDPKTGTNGQYGYYNGLPILNAGVGQNIVGKHGELSIGNPDNNEIGQNIPELGMDFASFGESTAWKAGPSIVGIEFDRKAVEAITKNQPNIETFTNWMDAFWDAASQGKFDPKKITTTEQIDELIAQGILPPQPTEGSIPGVGALGEDIYGEDLAYNTRVRTEKSGDRYVLTDLDSVQRELEKGAKKLDIDPSKYKTPLELYDAIYEKTNGLYQVVGSAESAGLMNKAVNPTGKNHFNALYKQYGDKLVPVDVEYFQYDRPKDKGFFGIKGFLGDALTGIARTPGVAELTAAMTGMNPSTYAALKAVQVGGLTNDVELGLKAGAKAWLLSQGAQAADTAIGNALIDAGMTDINIVNALSNVGGNVAANISIAALDGKSLSDAGVASLIASAISSVAKGTATELGIPPKYMPVVTQILTDTILKKDLENTLTKLALKEVTNEVKGIVKSTEKGTANA